MGIAHELVCRGVESAPLTIRVTIAHLFNLFDRCRRQLDTGVDFLKVESHERVDNNPICVGFGHIKRISYTHTRIGM